jgi:hypothetical protein
MLILLSPAKKLAEPKSRPNLKLSEPELKADVAKLVKHLQAFKLEELQNLMGLSDALSILNFERYKHFDTSWKKSNQISAALYTFDGDVYANMDIANYSSDDVHFANEVICILSGLYGFLKPLSMMQPYRLEMGTKLEGAWGKSLYDFWGDKITKQLKIEAAGQPVVNLASQEYAKAVDFSAFNKVITIDFKHAKEGSLKTIGTLAKRARGMMADTIIKHRIKDVELLKHFNEDDYKFSDELSTEDNWVFVKVLDI